MAGGTTQLVFALLTGASAFFAVTLAKTSLLYT
jgi:hypothetical protein